MPWAPSHALLVTCKIILCKIPDGVEPEPTFWAPAGHILSPSLSLPLLSNHLQGREALGEASEHPPAQQVWALGLPVGKKVGVDLKAFPRLTLLEQRAPELKALQRPLLASGFCQSLPVNRENNGGDFFAPRN